MSRAQEELDRRLAILALQPVLWLIRDALDRYVEAVIASDGNGGAPEKLATDHGSALYLVPGRWDQPSGEGWLIKPVRRLWRGSWQLELGGCSACIVGADPVDLDAPNATLALWSVCNNRPDEAVRILDTIERATERLWRRSHWTGVP